MNGKYQGSVTALGGRCCDLRAAAKRNAEQMQREGDEEVSNLRKKYKSYSDLLA